MDPSREDPLLIDLDKSTLVSDDENPPLIPALKALPMSAGNNPFDTIAEQTNQDPFEMVLQKASSTSDDNAHLDICYDLVSLNDSDDKNSSASRKTPSQHNDSETHNLAVSTNSDHKNLSLNSCLSPILSPNYLSVGSHLAKNQHSKNSLCTSDENSDNQSKKFSTSINISSLSSVSCMVENSINESGNSSVFLGDTTLPDEKSVKDFVAARIQNILKKTLNKSFAGFDRNKDVAEQRKVKSKSSAISVSTDDGTSPKNESESKTYSDFSNKSYGSMNRGLLKTTQSLIRDSIFLEEQEVRCDEVKTPISHEKYKINSSLFQSPPVEILREATKLSRSFSVGDTNVNLDNHEDLHSIKPKWETLDSSSDDDDCSDDSLKSLRLNIQRTSISTPLKETPDSDALKKFKKRLSLLASADSTAEKEPAVKPRSRSADRTISDSALKSYGTKTYPMNLPSALHVSKLEDVKLRPKNPEHNVKSKQGPMKAFVPLKNMLRGRGPTPTKKPASPASKVQTKSPVPKSPAKKSTIKPAASSTPKRIRKPLAESNAQDSPNPNPPIKSYQKHRRSNSYEIKNTTVDGKISHRSSSASRVSGEIKPPTPVSKLPCLMQGSPNRARNEYNTTPKKKIAVSLTKVRQTLYSGKENVNRL